MPSTRRLCAAAAVLLVAGWLGCASKPAPRDHFYRVEVAAPTPLASPALPGVLEVDRLRVEAIAQGRRMLYRDASAPNAIGQHSYHYWADPPGVMVQDQLVRGLRAAGAAKSVITPGIHVDSDFVLKGRIVQMERHTGGSQPRVVVELEFSLLGRNDRKLLLHETYREERTAAGEAIGASVTAYQDALGAILQQLVNDLPRP